jgi:hypothetical protein
MTRERRVRLYADHLALKVRGANGAFTLWEKYDDGPYHKRKIGGPYRTVDTLERGIVRYGNRMLRELKGKR